MSLVAQMARDMQAHNHDTASDSAQDASQGRLPLFAAAEQLYGNSDSGNSVRWIRSAALLLGTVALVAAYSYLKPEAVTPAASIVSNSAIDSREITSTKIDSTKIDATKIDGTKIDSKETASTEIGSTKIASTKIASTSHAAALVSAESEVESAESQPIKPRSITKTPITAPAAKSTAVAASPGERELNNNIGIAASAEPLESTTESKAVIETRKNVTKVVAAADKPRKVIQASAAGSSAIAVKTHRPLSNAQRDAQIKQEANSLLSNGLRASAIAYLETHLDGDYSKINSGALYLSLLIEEQRYSEVEALLPQYQQSGSITVAEGLPLAKLEVRLAIAQQQYTQAVALIDQLSVPLNRDADFMVMRAAALQAQGDYRQAAASYKRLLAFDSQQARWWMGLAVALDADAKFAEAKQAYRNALSLTGAVAGTSLPDNLSHYASTRIAQL